MPRRLAVIGAGRTASSIARALLDRGWPIAAITCRSPESARAASEFLAGAPVSPSNSDAALAGELILVGVPDREIAAVAREVAARGDDLAGRVVLHLSGALDRSELEPLSALGASLGSLHPLQTFPERVEQPDYLAGITCAVEGDDAAMTAAEEVVAALQARPLRLRAADKARYHAAASVASNHLTALVDLSFRLLGLPDRTDAARALLPLVLSTLSAIQEKGPERALTGPIARGDAETLARHLDGLDGADRALYLALSRATLELARRGERLEARADQAVVEVLAEQPVVVVASLRAPTVDGLVERARRATGADLIEYRLDLLDEPAKADLEPLVGPRSIITCRPGERVDARTSRRLLERALELGTAYVDAALGEEEGLPRDRLVLSWHGSDRPKGDARTAAEAIAARRPAVGKVALTDWHPAVLPLIGGVLRRGCERIAVLGMGDEGRATRILSRILGSDWTYASLGDDEPTAPGQVSLAHLLDLYRVRSVGRSTRLFGLVGQPLGHSLSPMFMNRILPDILHDAVYVPIGSLRQLLGFEIFPFEGVSVTMPFKVQAAVHASKLLPEAAATGSVNTLLRRGERWLGANTDVAGIAAVAAELMPVAGRRATVLGAGGAARAAAYALARAGMRVMLVARRPQQAHDAAGALGVGAAEAVEPGSWDLLVNATPLGMHPGDPLPLDATALDGAAVLDLVYRNGVETPLVRAARARGLAAQGGLEVLLAQGAEQVRLFTGVTVDRERLRQALA